LGKKNNVARAYATEKYIKTRIGSILFTIILDRSFFEFAHDFDSEKHNHSFYEIHFVVKGSGSVEVNGQSFGISPNVYYIIAPGVYHQQRLNSENILGKYSFRMECKFANTREDFFPAEESSRITEIFKSIHFFSTEDVHNNLSLLFEIRSELLDQQIGYYSRIQTLFSQLIINIIRDMASKQKDVYDIPERFFYEKRNMIIENFFEYNYNIDASASDLAKLLHVSIRQLDRIIKESFNMSYKQRMLEKRIETAKSLLKNTNLPVKAISERVGYETESNFCAIFKQKCGCTPTKYRYDKIENQAAFTDEKPLSLLT